MQICKKREKGYVNMNKVIFDNMVDSNIDLDKGLIITKNKINDLINLIFQIFVSIKIISIFFHRLIVHTFSYFHNISLKFISFTNSRYSLEAY